MGLFWEDFKVGDVFDSPSRTITEADVVNFAAFSGDWNPIHCDEEFAKKSPFKKRIAHGLLGLTVASGLGERERILEGTIIAFMAMEWKFVKPIFIGDTIKQRRVVQEKTESRDTGRGVLKWKVEILNQDGEVVQEGIRTVMIRRKSADQLARKATHGLSS
jgi:acyl dehydratase